MVSIKINDQLRSSKVKTVNRTERDQALFSLQRIDSLNIFKHLELDIISKAELQ